MHHRAHERTATDLNSRRARRTRSALGLALLAAATAALATGTARPLRFSAEDILPNDNRIGAGKLRDGVLTLHLEARKGTLHPRGKDGPGFQIEAFG